jgi:excisionase family DNA binding protein
LTILYVYNLLEKWRMEERWLSVDEIAVYLGVKRDTVYRWINKRALPARRLGRLWKFRKHEVEDWITRGTASQRTLQGAGLPSRGGLGMPPSPVEAELLRSDPTLAEIVRRLVEAYEPERIYLFGSRARGESGPHSDYDLLVVVPDAAPPERRRSRLAYERLWGTGAAADVLVCTKADFHARLHVPSSLPATVVREGKVLHAA